MNPTSANGYILTWPDLSDITELCCEASLLAFPPIPLDFVPIQANDAFDQTNFSAIKWTYDGSTKPFNVFFGGEFLLNISLNQLVYLQNRHENHMLEVVGVQENWDFGAINTAVSENIKVFLKTDDIGIYNTSVSADTMNVYKIGDSDNKPTNIDQMKSKYGRLRWAVSDKFSLTTFLNDSLTDVDMEKIIKQKEWVDDLRNDKPPR